MQVKILQKGGDKDHYIIEKATRYFARKLMSQRMISTLSLRIEIRATKLNKHDLGSVSMNLNGSKQSKEFMIMLQRDLPLAKQLETIAHEMVHVWQQRTNVLQTRIWKSDEKLHVRWNAQDMGLLSSIPYNEQPWEKEAFTLEEPLLYSFIAHHKEILHRTEELDNKLNAVISTIKRSRDKDAEMSL